MYTQIKNFIKLAEIVFKKISIDYNIPYEELHSIYILPFENSLKIFRKKKKISPYNNFCKENRKIIKKKYQNELIQIENNPIYKNKSEISKAKFSFITKKLSEEWKIIQNNQIL